MSDYDLTVPRITLRHGVELYDYQRDAIAQIVEAEERGFYYDVRGQIPLTEPFGSGKTFIIMGLLIHSPIPPLQPAYDYWRFAHSERHLIYYPTRPNQVTRPTAIVVGRSVYAQWLRNLQTFTGLRVYEARDVSRVIQLVRMIRNGDINDYDCVLIKYGKTSSASTSAPSRSNAREQMRHELCDVINAQTFPHIWARVIYDDVDLISKSSCLRAVSSIYVTGATVFRPCLPRQSEPNVAFTDANGKRKYALRSCVGNIYPNMLPALAARAELDAVTQLDFAKVRRAFVNGKMWSRLGHDPAMIAQNHGVYAIRWLLGSIVNREMHRAIRLIGHFDDSPELLAMITSDAMITAAKMLHIAVVTPAAMFASVLGDRRESYEIAKIRLEILGAIRAIPQAKRVDREAGAEKQIAIPREQITRAQREIEGIDDPFDVESLLRASETTLDEIIATTRTYTQRLDRSFERIQENMSDQMCGICCFPLADLHVVITRCCGYVMCSQCCSSTMKFAQSAPGKIIGRCVQCRQPVDVAKDIIFVESGADIGMLVRDARTQKADSNASDTSKPSAPAPNASSSSAPVHGANGSSEPADDAIRTKTGYILALLTKRIGNAGMKSPTCNVAETEREDIIGVMNGTQYVAPKTQRVLVCASYDEPLHDLGNTLAAEGIPYGQLCGNISNFAHIIEQYTSGAINILLINTNALYAGVDLQVTTDLVLFDERTPNIGQIIGRAQRLGRTCSLHVHILRYVD